MTLLLEATPEGLNAALRYLYTTGLTPERIITDPNDAGLFDELQSAPACAEETIALLPHEARRLLLLALLSEEEKIYPALLSAALRCLREGESALADRQDAAVGLLHKRAQSVLHEAHRWKGAARFGETAHGIMLARLAPKYAILPLLGSHFRQRLCATPWAITDEQRGRALYYDGHTLHEGNIVFESEPCYTEEEAQFRALWQRFFDAVAIRERTNPALQRRFLPRRFRRWLVENLSPPPKPAYEPIATVVYSDI